MNKLIRIIINIFLINMIHINLAYALDVNIQNPVHGTTVSGLINILVDSNENYSSELLDIYINDVYQHQLTSRPYEYTWDTRQVENGYYTIKALYRAYRGFNYGWDQSEHSITVNVNNEQNSNGACNGTPGVSLVSPVNGQNVHDEWIIVAESDYNDLCSRKIEFYIDNVYVGEDNKAPYTYAWDTTTFQNNTSHNIKAVIKEYHGGNYGWRSAETNNISVSINNTVEEIQYGFPSVQSILPYPEPDVPECATSYKTVFVPILVDDITVVIPTEAVDEVNCLPSSMNRLRWWDVFGGYELSGGASGKQLVIEVDMDRLHRTAIHENDPYWFKYFRDFWNMKGEFINNGILGQSAPTTSCQGEAWIDEATEQLFTADRYIEKYNTRTCINSVQKNTNNICQKWHANHYRGRIGDYIPAISSLGPNYNLNATASGITLNFETNMNMYIPLSAETSTCTEAGYWRRVIPGEVTPDGWGIVPMSAEPEGNYPEPFFDWIFIVPKGKDVKIANCRPGSAGCSEKLSHGGQVTIYDPPLWGPSDEEKLLRLLNKGQSFGIGDDITVNDRNAEGLYLMYKNANGNWEYKKNKLSVMDAIELIKSCKCLTVNGSGNNFDSGMANAALMADEFERPFNIHFYLAQPIGVIEYATAENLLFRQFMSQFTSSLNADPNIGMGEIKIQTHSWGGYLTWITGGNTNKIHHLAYATATLPTYQLDLLHSIQNWQGTGVMYIGLYDPVTGLGQLHEFYDYGDKFKLIKPRNNHFLSDYVANTQPE